MRKRAHYLSHFADAIAAGRSDQFARLVQGAFRSGASREELHVAVQVGRQLGQAPVSAVAEAYSMIDEWYGNSSEPGGRLGSLWDRALVRARSEECPRDAESETELLPRFTPLPKRRPRSRDRVRPQPPHGTARSPTPSAPRPDLQGHVPADLDPGIRGPEEPDGNRQGVAGGVDASGCPPCEYEKGTA